MFKKKEGGEGTSSELDAPMDLPDSFMEKYGSEEEFEGVNKKDSRRLPEDLVQEDSVKHEVDESDSKIEFLEENTESSEEEVGSEGGVSFFSELEKSIVDNSGRIEGHLSSSLVDMMKKFHFARSRGEHFFFHEQELEDALYKKMLKLKEIEEEWIIRAREFNAAKELLSEKESEIHVVSEELKSLIKKADRFRLFNKKAVHDEAFVLKEGKFLLCINDLLRELHHMSEEVFEYHVSSYKNDFSDWVLHVFREGKLADLMKNCGSREELIKLLSEY